MVTETEETDDWGGLYEHFGRRGLVPTHLSRSHREGFACHRASLTAGLISIGRH